MISERLQAWLKPGSGPVVARLYHRVFALICLSAWLSLASQILLLVGSDGLLPWDEFQRGSDLQFSAYPTIFFSGASDATLFIGTWIGVGLSCAAFVGIYPRVCAALNAVLYLSYIAVCRWFLWFQWDSLLVECAVIAVFLPTDRKSFWAHTMFRLLLFKLYFEAGVAKLHSPSQDWLAGTAMTYYYETSPLPTWLGWYAHHLPEAWHVFESWAVMLAEVFGALLILGGRRMRLIAFIGFSTFMLINLATSNYGFFCHLALALHLFLLDDKDLSRIGTFVTARIPAAVTKLAGRMRAPKLPTPRIPPGAAKLGRVGAAVLICTWISLSTLEGLATFADYGGMTDLRRKYVRLRVFNVYHLFPSVTRDRVEPQFETRVGGKWTAHHLGHKPGDMKRPPGFVAPHMPRVDFLLWFYGLRSKGTPRWVRTLVDRMCYRPKAVQQLFRTELPPRPTQVRIQFYRYEMTSFAELREHGLWWKRSFARTAYALDCYRRDSSITAVSIVDSAQRNL